MAAYNEIIDYHNMMSIMRMMIHRRYDNPVILLIPIQKKDNKKSKKRGLRKSSATAEEEAEIRRQKEEEIELEPLIIFKQKYKNDRYYENKIKPLFYDYYLLVGDCNRMDMKTGVFVFDIETYPINKLVLILGFEGNGHPEVKESMISIFNAKKDTNIEDLESCIIITPDPLTPPAMKLLNKTQEVILQHFQIDEIMKQIGRAHV